MKGYLLWLVTFTFAVPYAPHAGAQSRTQLPTAVKPPPCLQIKGLDELESRKARFIIFGELHGTAQIPAFFGDVVCQFSRSSAVVVALEFERREAMRIESFINQTPKASTADFLQHGGWIASEHDGRTSEAMLALIRNLRDFVKAGRRVDIVGIMPSGHDELPQSYYELGMAGELRRAAQSRPDATILVLVGNLHARKSSIAKFQNLRPAASLLPDEDVISLVNESEGGSSWSCQVDGCSVHEIPPGKSQQRGVFLNNSHEGYDGHFATGETYLASPPAIGGPG